MLKIKGTKTQHEETTVCHQWVEQNQRRITALKAEAITTPTARTIETDITTTTAITSSMWTKTRVDSTRLIKTATITITPRLFLTIVICMSISQSTTERPIKLTE